MTLIATTANPPETVDLLVLGAGWTSTFLLPLLTARKISYAATTRAGSPTTIAFTFDPASDSQAPFRALPAATTVLITFPITGTGHSQRLVDLYTATHPSSSSSSSTQFIQLGSTSVWSSAGTSTRHAPIDAASVRGRAESELLALGGTVLNLAGLWDGSTRDPKRWLERVADTKDKLRVKGRLHLVHGEDVARAVVAVHHQHTAGQRWLVTDMRSYDWWDLALAWGQPPLQAAVVELMAEAAPPVGVLPRAIGENGGGGDGRVLDSSEFWQAFGLVPTRCLF